MAMKKFLLAGLLSFGLMGCVALDTNEKTESAYSSNQDAQQVIHFNGPYDLVIELKTTDGFETATMTDNSGQERQLKRVVSGSGIKLEGADGASIHFKTFNGRNEGVLSMVPGRDISLIEFDPNSIKE